MGTTIVEVVEVIAPIALEALAKAAVDLLTGTNLAVAGNSDPIGSNPEQDGKIIQIDTTTYVNNQFALNYRYYYKGLGSSPPHAVYPLIAATEDIIVWNPKKNITADIQGYISDVMKDSIPDGDVIEVASNLTNLFLARFKEVNLSWIPFNKRYNLTESGLIIDIQMITAAGHDPDNNPLGVATYCFVAYKTK